MLPCTSKFLSLLIPLSSAYDFRLCCAVLPVQAVMTDSSYFTAHLLKIFETLSSSSLL